VNGATELSPRVGVTLGLGSSTRLKGGFGVFRQSPGYEKLIQADYFVDLSGPSAIDLESQRALHFVLGAERELGRGASLRVEGYYKRFDDLILGRLETEAERLARVSSYDFPLDLAWSVPVAPQITSQPENGGRGRAYGFDVLLSKRATAKDSRLSGWASYTWGTTQREAYGRTLPFDYDRRHALSAVGSLRVSDKLDVAATARLASGFPRTPVQGLVVAAVEDAADADGDGNRGELVPQRDPLGLLVYTTSLGEVADLNSARLPWFGRLDLRLNWRPRGANGRWLFYLDLINVTNRKNAGAYEVTLEHDPASDRPRYVETAARSLPFLPSVGVRFRF
jgi:hypothetical protein